MKNNRVEVKAVGNSVAEYLLNMHKIWCLVPSLALKQAWCFTLAIPVCRRLRQRDQKFKVNLSYIASWRPAWETRNFVSKRRGAFFSHDSDITLHGKL